MEFDWIDCHFDLKKITPPEVEEVFEDPFSIRLCLKQRIPAPKQGTLRSERQSIIGTSFPYFGLTVSSTALSSVGI